MNEDKIKVFKDWKVDNEYSLRWQSRLPDALYLEQHEKYLLQGFSILPWKARLSEERKAQMNNLKKKMEDKFWVRIALYHKDEMVGWSYGWQDSVHQGDFYMAGSLVLPEHRRKGLYSTMLEKILLVVKEEGFSSVRSRHICTNNSVLIAKLKAGFIINGFEQDETMGTFVRMIFHHDELRKKATYFRAGKIGELDVYNSLTS